MTAIILGAAAAGLVAVGITLVSGAMIAVYSRQLNAFVSGELERGAGERDGPD